MYPAPVTAMAVRVALLAEGVDRNTLPTGNPMAAQRVALLAEGVDRNVDIARDLNEKGSRPPRGGRG